MDTKEKDANLAEKSLVNDTWTNNQANITTELGNI